MKRDENSYKMYGGLYFFGFCLIRSSREKVYSDSPQRLDSLSIYLTNFLDHLDRSRSF